MSKDNFKHHRPRKPRYLSTDGFMPPSASKGSSINFSRDKQRQGKTPGMDDFKRPEGFHSGYQPVINNSLSGKSDTRPLLTDSERLKRHKGEKDPKKAAKGRKWPKRLMKSGAILAVCAILVTGFIFAKGYINARKVFKGGADGAAALSDEIDISKLKTEGDGRVNILVLGKGGDGHEGPDLTDTILVISIDTVQKEAGILSIPRDLYVRVPEDGSEKINAVYANAKQAVLDSGTVNDALIKQAEEAGIKKVEQVVTEVTSLNINYYVMVDFEGFRQAIDTVGGVTVNVNERLVDPTVAWENNWNPVIAEAGPQNFDGKKALLYSRSRHGTSRGDFDRAERQREVILALKDKVLSTGTFANPVKISQLLDTFGSHVQTNLSLNEVNQLYNLSHDIPGDKVYSIGLSDPPISLVTTAGIGGLSVVVPVEGTYEYGDIQNYLHNILRDGLLRKENARVVVLNGTDTPGLATQKGEQLRALGYNITQISDAPTKNYQQATIVDIHGNRKYTKHYLEQRFKVAVVSSLPDKNISAPDADFVIILGNNETTAP